MVFLKVMECGRCVFAGHLLKSEAAQTVADMNKECGSSKYSLEEPP